MPKTEAFNLYKKFRNALNRTITKAKKMYFENKLLNNESNSKNQWKVIHNIIGKKN